MSAVYSTLLGLTPMLYAIQVRTYVAVCPLVQLLAKLSASKVWWLPTDKDRRNALDYVPNQNEEKFHLEMFSFAIKFDNMLAKLGEIYPLVKQALVKSSKQRLLSCSNTLYSFTKKPFLYAIRILKQIITPSREV